MNASAEHLCAHLPSAVARVNGQMPGSQCPLQEYVYRVHDQIPIQGGPYFANEHELAVWRYMNAILGIDRIGEPDFRYTEYADYLLVCTKGDCETEVYLTLLPNQYTQAKFPREIIRLHYQETARSTRPDLMRFTLELAFKEMQRST